MKKTIYLFCLLICFCSIAQAQNTKQTQSLEQAAKQKADAIAKGVEQYINNMTFEEFEAFFNKSPYAGQLTRAELKKEYNKLHKNDGKAVKINPEDYKKNEKQKMIEAFKGIDNAKNFKEYRHYMKMLSPELSDEEIKQMWEAQKKENEAKNARKRQREREKAKEVKKDTIDNDGAFDFGDLFGGGSEDRGSKKSNKQSSNKKSHKNSNNNGSINLSEIDLGGLMDFMESDEAAELGKKADEIEKEFDEDKMERMVKDLEDKMPKDRVEFLKMSGLTERQAVTLDAALTANDDPNASIAERDQKLRDYFHSFGPADERIVDFGVAMTINTDQQKGVTSEYDKQRKKDYEEHLEDYEHGKMKLDSDEIALVLRIQLQNDYGIRVPGDMSEEDLKNFTHEFMSETEKQRGWEDDTWNKCLEKVAKRRGFEKKSSE